MFACMLRNYDSWPVILYKRKAAYSLGMTAGELSDLIDPTCEVRSDNRFASDFRYVCQSCGEHFSTCDTPNYCPGCGARVVDTVVNPDDPR